MGAALSEGVGATLVALNLRGQARAYRVRIAARCEASAGALCREAGVEYLAQSGRAAPAQA
jgi:hypothetical protein